MKQPTSYWKITEDCNVFIDTSSLTIHFNKGIDRHYDNIGIEEKLEKVIQNDSLILKNLFSYNFPTEIIEEIIYSATYFYSNEYLKTLSFEERVKIEKSKDKTQNLPLNLNQRIELITKEIKVKNKRSIIAYAILMVFIILLPIIWGFNNERALLFLLPVGLLLGIFIYQVTTLIKARPMFGEAHVVEFYNSKTTFLNPTLGTLKIPNVVFVKVKSHDLYQIHSNAIDYMNSIRMEECSYQVINNLNTIIYNKKHIQFVLNTDNEIYILE